MPDSFRNTLFFFCKNACNILYQRRDLSKEAIWNHVLDHHGVGTYVVVGSASNYIGSQVTFSLLWIGVIVKGYMYMIVHVQD